MSAECGQTCLLALLTLLLLLRLLLFDKYNYRAVEVEDHSTLKFGGEIRGHSLPVRLVCGSKYSGSFYLGILTSMSQIEVVVSHIRLYIVTFGIMYSIFIFIFQCTVLEEVGRVGGLSLYTMEQHRVDRVFRVKYSKNLAESMSFSPILFDGP